MVRAIVDRQANQSLVIAGVSLVLFGLVLGAAIPVFANPRMALSAHQQGVIGGILLVLFGLTWPWTVLSDRQSRVTERLLTVGAYAIWVGILLAAAFGTSRATPLAGAGFEGARWQELSVSIVLMFGSLSAIFGTALLLVGLFRGARRSGKDLT
jgi:hydroxylaminobenzene mutase